MWQVQKKGGEGRGGEGREGRGGKGGEGREGNGREGEGGGESTKGKKERKSLSLSVHFLSL